MHTETLFEFDNGTKHRNVDELSIRDTYVGGVGRWHEAVFGDGGCEGDQEASVTCGLLSRASRVSDPVSYESVLTESNATENSKAEKQDILIRMGRRGYGGVHGGSTEYLGSGTTVNAP